MVLNLFAESKICQLEHFIVNENVIRFDVTMDKLSIIKHLITPTNLLQNIPNTILRHESHLRNETLQRSLVAVLHNDVEIVAAEDLGLDAVDKVLVVRQLVQHLELGLNRLLVFRGQQRYDLDHQLLTGTIPVVGPEDLAIGSLAQRFVL